jgi:hypothetical protein
MAYGTFLKFHHNIDIYSKTVSVNAAGQRAVTFAKANTIAVHAQWTQSDIVNQPYLGNFDQLEIFVPKNNVNQLSHEVRFKDLKDRYGNTIDSSYYEVVGIQKKMQFNGKVHHAVVSLRRVVED